MNKAIFLDKDGTLIKDVPYNVNPGKITLSDYVGEGLKLLHEHSYLLVVISNQAGVALGYFEEKELQHVNTAINDLLLPYHVTIDDFYYCPHHPVCNAEEYNVPCNCRKPLPGLIYRAAKDYDIDLVNSWMIGDILNDVETGNRAGCKTIIIDNGNETVWELNKLRSPDFIAANFKEAVNIVLSNHSSIIIKEVYAAMEGL